MTPEQEANIIKQFKGPAAPAWVAKTKITSAEAAELFSKQALRLIDVQRPNPAVTILVWSWYWAAPLQRLKLYLTKMGDGVPDNAQWRLE